MTLRLLTILYISLMLPATIMAQYEEPSLIIYYNNASPKYIACDQIDSITYSKYDIQVQLCDKVVTQQLHTPDSLLRMPIADIDSMKVLTLPSYCPDSHHPHAIDLGLPGGVKWACCNVGATVPEGFGGYYSWGEVDEKDKYMEYHYVHGEYDEKQNEFSYYDIGSNISKTEYDVAYVTWGEPWCMPSRYDYLDLIYNSECQYVNYHGVDGWIFTGPNGNSVFMPSAGNKSGAYHPNGLRNWTSSAYTLNDYNNYAYFMTIVMINDNSLCNIIYGDRSLGQTIRPVVK